MISPDFSFSACSYTISYHRCKGTALFKRLAINNVKGRISYISSHARQENLYSVYETVERSFWKELAKCNREEFKKSGTDGKCIEARELIIALPENFVEYNPDALLRLFTEEFHRKYGVECISAEYSCAVTPQIRQTGNRLSGNAGTAYASLLA